MRWNSAICLRLCLLVLLLPAPANAASPAEGGDATPVISADTSGWLCTLCPYRTGWWGEIDVGAGTVSDSSNKFGDYRGLNEKGGFAALDGEAHYRSEGGGFLDIVANDLGIDSRRFEARAGERGRYSVTLRYREIPKYRGFGAQSPFLGVGGNNLTLPTGWQSAQSTSEMSGLTQSLQPVELMTTRRIFDAAVSWRLGQNFSWEAEYQHQSRNGTRPFGAGVFTIDSSHVPAPIDFSTDRVVLGLNFAGDRSRWRAGFMGSRFDNNQASFTWQNPFTPISGTEVLSASLAPDNEAYRFDLAGAWSPISGIRLHGSAALGRMQQDDLLLPYSINPEFSELPLPRLTANTRVDTSTVDLSGRLNARISKGLDLNARLDLDRRDNRTPIDIWTPVITDLVQSEPRPNRPYSFERQRADLSIRYRPRRAFGLQAGIKREYYERSLQSVAESSENSWFVEATIAAGSKVSLRARLEHADRDGQPYLPVPDFALPDHPLMRKFNLADRNREKLGLDLDLYPVPEMLINFSYRKDEDRYRESYLGLLASNSDSLSFNMSWNPTRTTVAYMFMSQEDYDSTLAGMEFNAPTPWVANTDDSFLTAGIGLTLDLGTRIELGFDVVSSKAEGDIRTDSGLGEAPFPTLETDLLNAKLSLDYRTPHHWGFRLLVEYEHYDSTDWALDGLGPAGIPAILAFGAESPDYDVTVIRAQASYRF